LAARLRESGLTVYGFGERKTPKPCVAACDKCIYIENLAYAESAAAPAETALLPKSAISIAQLKGDTTLVNLLRNAVEAASDDDGWASLSAVGSIITKQRPEFDSRTYGFSKLSDLITATTLFEVDRRIPGEGKPSTVYVCDRRRRSDRDIKATPAGS
jgi:hypothetical protein